MERLTTNNNHFLDYEVTVVSRDRKHTSAELYERLAEYEDTGLTPEEIKDRLEIERAFSNVWEDNAMKAQELIKRLKEQLKAYRQAEEQGLLIKLPCKIGDMVYIICPGTNGAGKMIDVLPFTLALFGFYNKVGINIFLTREAAEEALKGSEEQ